MEDTAQKESLFEGVTGYHWLIVIIASCGWLFDCMDQRLFILARTPALRELLGSDAAAQARLGTLSGWATASMILGWATGGIIFGMMSDKVGRVKTMMATLMVYSGFTGLSGCATSWVDFMIYRFLVGLGVGGMFGAATTLVAESVPSKVRPLALGALQALSASGNMLGSYISLKIPPGKEEFLMGLSGWRVLFFVGVIPAVLIIPIVKVLREPEAWKKKKEAVARGEISERMGSPKDIFKHPRWRRNAIVGLMLGISGMIGLWGIGFFSPELISYALSDTPLLVEDLLEPKSVALKLKEGTDPFSLHMKGRLPQETQRMLDEYDGSTAPSATLQQAVVDGLNEVINGAPLYREEWFQEMKLSKRINALIAQNPQEGERLILLNRLLVETSFPDELAGIQGYVDEVRSWATLYQDLGAFFGMFAFTLFATFLGRRIAFLGSFILALIVTMFVFSSLNSAADAYWMLPLMGFAQLALFGGYSIYFPELFPTRLRGTGVGFCYNTVRYLAAPGPILFGYLITMMSIRDVGMIMSFIFVLGMIALIWAPETKGQELPEE